MVFQSNDENSLSHEKVGFAEILAEMPDQLDCSGWEFQRDPIVRWRGG